MKIVLPLARGPHLEDLEGGRRFLVFLSKVAPQEDPKLASNQQKVIWKPFQKIIEKMLKTSMQQMRGDAEKVAASL